jgi:hypothetical protein
MIAITVTAKAQITLSKDILKHLGINPGEKITVDKLSDGRIKVKAARPMGKISDAFGFLKKENARPLSIEEMNEIAGLCWQTLRITADTNVLLQ